MIDVGLVGQEEATFLCLLDTGSLGNRFGRWTADAAGLDLAAGEETSLGVGGLLTTALTVPVELELAGHRWQAPISFCDPWPAGFQLLGQEGFFRFFRVTLRAATYELEVEAEAE